MKQLKLSEDQLKLIGFIKKEITEEESFRTVWEIATINGCFYYNPDEEIYVWYHKTVISNFANFIHLDITNKAELFTVLSAFRSKFNLVIKD